MKKIAALIVLIFMCVLSLYLMLDHKATVKESLTTEIQIADNHIIDLPAESYSDDDDLETT